MISFILNNKEIITEKPSGTTLLDFIRYDVGLMGTKIGCREGDCGACSVLEGSLSDGKMLYKSIVSCLTPLGNVHGKHIVTIEGLNQHHLNPIQSAFIHNSATQCGFCTPGFIISLTAHSLSYNKPTKPKSIAAISGNICRCTGYKSIERAIDEINDILKDKNADNPINWLVVNGYLPDYFSTIAERIERLPTRSSELNKKKLKIIAGGTDLMVQIPEELAETDLVFYQNESSFRTISVRQPKITLGASITVSDIEQSYELQHIIPSLIKQLKLVSSEPIRNMGTVAGNIMNASPIGDLSIILLALEAIVNTDSRNIPLKEFFVGYKKLKIDQGGYIQSVEFDYNPDINLFNFEKVSKRTHLDIASVNSAIKISVTREEINKCSLSMGGVSPIPLYLKETSAFLSGKRITSENLATANGILQQEISPISDIRGSAEYKRLLARQLLYAHFVKLFPTMINIDQLF